MARLVSRAIKNNKANQLFQIGEPSPFWELCHMIFAHEAINRCIGSTLPNLLDCIDRVGRCRASQFAIVHTKSGFLTNRRPNHG